MDSDNKLDCIKDDITDIKVSLSKIESTLERNTNCIETHKMGQLNKRN